MCCSGTQKGKQSNALFLIVGNWRWLHFATAALPGCGFGYTSVRLLRSLVVELKWLVNGTLGAYGHLSKTHLCQTHSCHRIKNKGRENERLRERVGWERKENLRHRRETSDNIQRMKLVHMSPDNACHLYCWVTWPAMSQKAHGHFEQGSCFCLTCKNSLWPFSK